VSINSKRPYEVSPIPTFNSTIPKSLAPPIGKGISVTVTMQIPFAKIFDILKQMYENGQASAEDLQQAAAELRKVADEIDNLASTLP